MFSDSLDCMPAALVLFATRSAQATRDTVSELATAAVVGSGAKPERCGAPKIEAMSKLRYRTMHIEIESIEPRPTW